MIHIPHVGIIYDVIYYGIIYYCKPAVIKNFSDHIDNPNEAFGFFEEVNNSCKTLPLYLLPFFYYDGYNISALSEYLKLFLEESDDLYNLKMVNYLDLIQNTEKFKKVFFDHLFSNLNNNDSHKLVKGDTIVQSRAIDNKPWPTEMKMQTALLINNFANTVNILHDYLKEIYKHVLELHKKYDKIVQKRIQETKDKEMLIYYEKLYSLSEARAAKQPFTLCFMNQFMFWNVCNSQGETLFLFGNMVKAPLKKQSASEPIEIRDLLSILGDDTKFLIIQTIQRYGSLAMTDVSRLAHIATSTASPLINLLARKNILLESHKEGQKVYFYVNTEALDSAIDSFAAFIKNLISLRGE